LIRILARNHQVDLISFTAEPVSREQLSMMNRLCQRITTIPFQPATRRPMREILGYFSNKPRSAYITHNSEMQSAIMQADNSRHYDALVSSQIDMAAYTQHWKSSPMVFEELELTGLYESQLPNGNSIRQWRRQLMWWKTKNYVKRLMRSYRGCTVASETERMCLQEILPEYDQVTIIPNGVDLEYLSGNFGVVEPNTMIYAGALTYAANLDAMVFFLTTIFPLIKQRRPDVKLYITGSTQGVDLSLLPMDDSVIFTGFLHDIRPRVAKSMVSIVPLRLGGGTRLKILEAMALRVPVVSTPKGCEGLHLVPGQDLLVADDPTQFAEAVLRLFDEQDFREQMAFNGCAKVREMYDWNRIGEKFSKMIHSMV
jgi:glycosyltransferase involved in cell wall biosynthesis